MRLICAAWASAILPHPTIATLSGTATSLPAAVEISPQPLVCRHLRRPAEEPLCFGVAIAASFPVGVPGMPVEHWGQLFVGPARIVLPQRAEHVAGRTRHRHGRKRSNISLVQAQK